MNVEYEIGRFMRVRKLVGTYQITDSWMVGGAKHQVRRYRLTPVKGTGALLLVTEAYADDMDPIPTAQTINLIPDEPLIELGRDEQGPIYKPDLDADALRDGYIRRMQLAQEQPQPVPAPDAEPGAADAIRSPAGTFTHDAGTFGGEPDEYSPGAQDDEAFGSSVGTQEMGIEKLQSPFKPVRKFPQRPSYQDLKAIVYNARFKGLEELDWNKQVSLPAETPVAVVVTHETNGHAIWVITTGSTNEDRVAYLEQFYPKATGSEAAAIEYAVLLALRQIPIRSEDLEILLLQLR